MMETAYARTPDGRHWVCIEEAIAGYKGAAAKGAPGADAAARLFERMLALGAGVAPDAGMTDEGAVKREYQHAANAGTVSFKIEWDGDDFCVFLKARVHTPDWVRARMMRSYDFGPGEIEWDGEFADVSLHFSLDEDQARDLHAAMAEVLAQ